MQVHQSAPSVPQASTLPYWVRHRQKCALLVHQTGLRPLPAAMQMVTALTSVLRVHLARTVVHASCVWMEHSKAFLARLRAHLVLKIQIQHRRAQPELTVSAKLVTLGLMADPVRRVSLVNIRQLWARLLASNVQWANFLEH